MLYDHPLLLEMESVSKCKKEKTLHEKKKEANASHANNVKFIPNHDDKISAPNLSTSTPSISSIKNNSPLKATTHTLHSPTHQAILQKILNYYIQDFSPHKAQNKEEELYKVRDFQDSNLTKHISEQILILKIMMMILAVLSMFLVHLRYEIGYYEVEGFIEDVILVFQSFITVSLIITHLIIHFHSKSLTEKQLIKFSIYQISPYGITWPLIIQILYLFIHPNYLCKDAYFETEEPINNQIIEFSINDLFQIFILGRIYLLYSAIITSSIYMSTRANRVCRIYGTTCDNIFGMKCMFNEMPLSALFVIFVSLLLVFAEMVRLCQQNSKSSNLGFFGNSLWCVIITMGTVGYGDYYPTTYLGRMILFLASISGIILSSLLILTLSTYLTMQLSQTKSHITLQRLKLRQILEESASSVVKQTARISKLALADDQKSPQILSTLKKKSEDVKYILRKIKNLVDTNNINQQMDRLFEALSDNIKEAYLYQQKYAQVLIELAECEKQRIEEMKFSFTEEIQNIIKDK